MCSCWVCCENRQARQYWHIYNYFFAMTNHMFIIFSRVAVLLRFAQLMIFWQLKLFVQIKVTTVQLVRFKILYLDICYETVIEFCLLQEWYCRPLRLYLWTKVNVTKAVTKYEWPKMKRDARQKCSLFLIFGRSYFVKAVVIWHFT